VLRVVFNRAFILFKGEFKLFEKKFDFCELQR